MQRRTLVYNTMFLISITGMTMLYAQSFHCSEGECTSRVTKLVTLSSTKQSICESNVLDKNPLEPTDLKEALNYLKSHPDHTSYHLLIAIGRYYPDTYKTIASRQKGEILSSALLEVTFLNDWGYLDPAEPFDDESAKALLETGQACIDRLIPMLEDGRAAPLFGSEEATVSRLYMFRRKDFTFRYISLIIGQAPGFAADPAIRDKDIAALKGRLKERGAKTFGKQTEKK